MLCFLSINNWEICMGALSISLPLPPNYFMYLFNSLYQYGLMDFFKFGVIIQYYFILLLKLFQLWSLGILSIKSWVSLKHSSWCELVFCCGSVFDFVCSSEQFLTSWPYRMLPFQLLYFLSQSYNQPFLQESWVILWENGVRIQDLDARCAHC